jgi:hypothetical protein
MVAEQEHVVLMALFRELGFVRIDRAVTIHEFGPFHEFSEFLLGTFELTLVGRVT